MQETVYSSLAASFEYYHRTGEPPPRAGNRQAALSSTPYNVYPAADGWVAIHVVTEGHWKNLIKAMGREELGDDPRFRTNADRVATHGRDRCGRLRMEPHLAEDGGVRAAEGRAGAVRAGAHRARGHARPAHARARHAGRDRAPRARDDHLADLAVAAARLGKSAGRAEPDDRASTTTRSMAAGSACRRRSLRRCGKRRDLIAGWTPVRREDRPLWVT